MIKRNVRALFGVVLVSVMAAMLQGCDPVPRRTLSTEEKIADLHWVYSQFTENYAPLEYKAQRYSFDYAVLKAKYLAEAETTRSNEEFYTLMFRFVSEFKDAHTSASLTNSGLPNRARIAYLGFSGKRKGGELLVTDLLPTIGAKSSYPIKAGDRVSKIDGVALADVVRGEMVKYRDLGHAEANLTYHMNKIFTRVSTTNGLPSRADAVLTLVEGAGDSLKERVVTLPWVVKDVVEFEKDQDAATPKKKANDGLITVGGEKPFRLGFVGFNGELMSPGLQTELLRRGTERFRAWNTFRFVDNVAGWTSDLAFSGSELGSRASNDATSEAKKLSSVELLKKQRNVPDHAIFLAEAKTFPVYLTRESLKDKEGKGIAGASKLVATMWLHSFSPEEEEATVMKEVKQTLETLEAFGVEDLVIDLINNGGGSLVLGMQLAQALSPEKIAMSEIQYRLSDAWLDDFENMSTLGHSDAERELFRRVLGALDEDRAQGARLSRRFPSESLAPFQILPNGDLAKKLNVVLLVNEMCASMCDIFTAMLKDNGMATVVGTQTMGAGGNVVEHSQAPNSHLILRQTESLILRKDGSFIENNGILPDVAMAVNESVDQKYSPVLEKGIELLTTAK